MAFHFFPRRPLDVATQDTLPTPDELELGEKILNSILRFGLLLVPERSPAVSGRPFATPRVCFTEASLNDLYRREVPVDGVQCNHFQIFGPYAIGIESRDARELGMSAVLSRASGGNDFTSFTDAVLDSLKDTYNTVVILSHLESIANPGQDWLRDRQGHALARARLDQETVSFYSDCAPFVDLCLRKLDALDCETAVKIETLFESLNPKRRPFWQLAQHLAYLIDMTQEADSNRPTNKRHLAYYKQREWRIIRSYHSDLHWVPLATEDAASLGLSIRSHPNILRHRDTFLAEQGRDDFDPSKSWLLAGKGNTPLCAFISEIVFPKCREGEVLSILSKLNYPLQIKRSPYELSEAFKKNE